jgi:hypothetical protein
MLFNFLYVNCSDFTSEIRYKIFYLDGPGVIRDKEIIIYNNDFKDAYNKEKFLRCNIYNNGIHICDICLINPFYIDYMNYQEEFLNMPDNIKEGFHDNILTLDSLYKYVSAAILSNYMDNRLIRVRCRDCENNLLGSWSMTTIHHFLEGTPYATQMDLCFENWEEGDFKYFKKNISKNTLITNYSLNEYNINKSFLKNYKKSNFERYGIPIAALLSILICFYLT